MITKGLRVCPGRHGTTVPSTTPRWKVATMFSTGSSTTLVVCNTLAHCNLADMCISTVFSTRERVVVRNPLTPFCFVTRMLAMYDRMTSLYRFLQTHLQAQSSYREKGQRGGGMFCTSRGLTQPVTATTSYSLWDTLIDAHLRS